MHIVEVSMRVTQRSIYLRWTLLLMLLGLIMAMPRSAASQDSRFTEFHTWSDVTTIYNFSARFRYDGDYGIRGLLTDRNWTQIYFRPSVRYRVRPWLSLHGGAALFYSFFNDVEDLPELRPWVGLRMPWPRIGGFVFSHYFRLELREFFLTGDDEWETVLRGRYQLQVRSPDFDIGAAKRLYVQTSVEVFEDLNSSITNTFGDRFRYNIGIGKGGVRWTGGFYRPHSV